MNSALDWTSEEFRRNGYAVVDALVGHWAHLREEPVRRQATRGEVEQLLEAPFDEAGRPFSEVLEEVLSLVLPHTMRVHQPRFFGFVPGPSNPASALADMLGTGFNVFTGTWMGGAGATVVERRLIGWLASELGLPAEAGGVFVSGGSMANLTALALARERHSMGGSPDAVVYFSDQTHSAVERGLRALGLTAERLRRIESDAAGRIRIERLREAMTSDRAAGLVPFCVVANAGTTSTGAVDAFPLLAELCHAEGLWLHADAAYGGAAALCERGKRVLTGLGKADSIALDPHKWLFQPFDLGCVLVRNDRELAETFRIMPAYMEDVYRMEREINFCDRGLELTRPFRGLKLWVSLRHFGAAAFRAAIERGILLAESAERLLRARAGWEVLTPAQLGIVTFRRQGDDALQHLLVERMMQDGLAVLTSTIVAGRAALRLCTINPRTREEDIAATIDRLEELARP
jgi:aromatic-L-amino-acid decarboxylase